MPNINTGDRAVWPNWRNPPSNGGNERTRKGVANSSNFNRRGGYSGSELSQTAPRANAISNIRRGSPSNPPSSTGKVGSGKARMTGSDLKRR